MNIEIDAERLAHALHETKGERIEPWESGARKRRVFLSTDPPFKAKPFADLPVSVQRQKVEEADQVIEHLSRTGPA